jgi:hypothetical protein
MTSIGRLTTGAAASSIANSAAATRGRMRSAIGVPQHALSIAGEVH